MQGTIKINCDATWCSTTRFGGMGVIARDHMGNICGGKHDSTMGGSVVEVEAKAILKGINMAIKMGWQNIAIKSDA